MACLFVTTSVFSLPSSDCAASLPSGSTALPLPVVLGRFIGLLLKVGQLEDVVAQLRAEDRELGQALATCEATREADSASFFSFVFEVPRSSATSVGSFVGAVQKNLAVFQGVIA